MKFILPFLFFTPLALAAQKQLEIKTLVYRNTAVEVFLEFDFSTGTVATLKIAYDDQELPTFTGKILMGQDGVPLFNAAGKIDYDSTVSPSSPKSNESRYTITGQITLEIGGHLWTGSSCNIMIYNNMPTLTTFDGVFIECSLTAPQDMRNIETQFKIQIRSGGANSMIQSTMLPVSTENFTSLNEASLNFSLRPVSGTRWVINSNVLSDLKVTQIIK